MIKRISFIVLIISLCFLLKLSAQHHEMDYVPETDPQVLKKLE